MKTNTFKRNLLNKNLHHYGNLSRHRLKSNQSCCSKCLAISRIIMKKKLISECSEIQKYKWLCKAQLTSSKCLAINCLSQLNYFIELQKTISMSINFMKNVAKYLIRWHYVKQCMEKLLEGIRHWFGIHKSMEHTRKIGQEVLLYSPSPTITNSSWKKTLMQFIIIKDLVQLLEVLIMIFVFMTKHIDVNL